MREERVCVCVSLRVLFCCLPANVYTSSGATCAAFLRALDFDMLTICAAVFCAPRRLNCGQAVQTILLRCGTWRAQATCLP